jgi:hypothetical protein
MSTLIDCANMAYAHLGKGTFIADLNENSVEAKVARLFQKPALKATLRDFHWAFATKITQAKLIEEDPNSEWGFAYRYPVDCLDLRRILSGQRVDTPETAVEYRVIGDSEGRVILTDKDEAEIEYTCFIDNAGLFPADFELAYSFRWATYLAPKILGADPTRQGERLMARYQTEIAHAKLNSGMEGRREQAPQNSYAAARGSSL